MELMVLGPIEARRTGQRIQLGRRQQRLVLAYLGLEAHHPVPTDRLINLLWGEVPPPRARAMVHTRISELRSILRAEGLRPEDHLYTLDGSYVLRLPAQNVDAHSFRDLLAEARSTASIQGSRNKLRQALSLWRGPALGGVRPGEAHGPVCEQLDSARLAAKEDLFDVELRLGRHFAVVEEALTAAGRHPERERFVWHAMLALHGCGRSAEALQFFDRWRRWLGKELGVDPSPATRDLHLAILNGVPAGALVEEPDGREIPTAQSPHNERDESACATFGAKPTSTPMLLPRSLPPEINDFVGRVVEAAELTETLSRRDGRVVLVTGSGGVGKTALCVQVAHRLSDLFPDGQLYADLRGTGDGAPRDPSEILDGFLRLLGVTNIPASLEGRAAIYRTMMANRAVLVVLDNAASDAQISWLTPNSSNSMVLANSRARLGTTISAHTIDVGGLSKSGAVELISLLAGRSRALQDIAATESLIALCSSLPLALRSVGARLATKPHWSLRKILDLLANERRTLDLLTFGHLSVRESIGKSYARLEPRSQQLLRYLGFARLTHVSVDVGSVLMATTAREADILLERLNDGRIVDFIDLDEAGQPRYQLNTLTRLFGAERAQKEDLPTSLSASRDRLKAYFREVTESISQEGRV